MTFPESFFELAKADGTSRTLPPGLRMYAIGDIHGRLDLLDRILAKTCEDTARRPVMRPVHVFLGDYIDRGTESRATIERLIQHGEDHESVFLKGNHEWLALKGLSDATTFTEWMKLGGVETLLSYGIVAEKHLEGRRIAELQSAFYERLPRSHIRFFRDLKPSFTCGDFHFVHAGVRPLVNLGQQKESDLLWIRDEFLSSTQDFGKIIVHGHTPSKDVEIRPNRINIDTGAFATGRLTSLVIENASLAVIDTLQSGI